jgi:hypothetical protein
MMEHAMELKQKVKSLLNEASVYDDQGLYEESREKYVQAVEIIKAHAHMIDHHKKLLNSISSRLQHLEKKIERMENESVAYQMPNVVLDVMKNKFSSAKDPEQAALEGALALAEFGQYESALEEFKKLIKHRTVRLAAAQNIARCHLAKGRAAKAVALFRHWRNSGLLGPDEMVELRNHLQKLSDDHGLNLELPDAEAGAAPGTVRSITMRNRQIMDFTSLSVRVPGSARKNRLREFDIRSQSGDIVNLLISNEEREVLEGLKKGTVLDPVQCFSTNAMFSGKATVVESTPIASGDHAGHFSVDIQIQGI